MTTLKRNTESPMKRHGRNMGLDPVLLEIIANKVVAAADEMATTLQRTSRTLFVKEASDFACALVGVDGRIFAHPRTSAVSAFVDMNAMPTIQAVPDLQEGDVIVTNDPYLSGALSTHLPDIHLLEPIFHKRRIVAYCWSFVHSTDVGGGVPGSILPTFHEIFQEGLRIPPIKLMEGGVLNDSFVEVFKANCRIPELNLGDVRAMLAALRVGRQRIADIIERHGVTTFVDAQAALQDYSEAKARAVLRRIPDGYHEFWDYLDDDVASSIPVRIRCRVTISNGELHIDLAGTDPEVKAAYNVYTADRMHEWLTMRFVSFLYTHDEEIVVNHGMFRPISANNPRGTVLNCEFPAALGHRHAPARRLLDALTGALLKAAPDMISAPAGGAGVILVLAEFDADRSQGQTVAVVQPMRGGMGAFVDRDGRGYDGTDGRDSTVANIRNNPLEIVESECGVVVREWDIRTDGGGPGRWRGGVGQLITVEILRDGGIIYGHGMERMRFPAWGVFGAKPAQRFRCILNRGRPNEQHLGKIDQVPVNAGDTVTMMMPGGGGYGNPLERDLEAVLRDVRQGFVSVEGAARDYGVAVVDGRIDSETTRGLRAQKPGNRRNLTFDFGAEREAWESVFDDETMCRLNQGLFGIPRSVRNDNRRWIFEQAIPELPRTGEGTLVEAITDPKAARDRLEQAMAAVFRAGGAATGPKARRL